MSHHPDAGDPRDTDRYTPKDRRAGAGEDGVLEELRREGAELRRAQGLLFRVDPPERSVDLGLPGGRGDPPPEKGEGGEEGGVEAGGGAGELVGADAGEGVLGVGEAAVVDGHAGGVELRR